MSVSDKAKSTADANQTLQYAFVPETKVLSVGGFISSNIGHKVTLSISTTTVPSDTETYTYSSNGNTIMAIKVIYTTGSRDLMLSAERIS